MNGRTPTKDEKAWLDAITQLGCIVCLKEFGIYSPGSPHHIEGSRKPGAHKITICLCWPHHQSDDSDPRYESVHGNKYRFEKRYGSQYELLEMTQELVA